MRSQYEEAMRRAARFEACARRATDPEMQKLWTRTARHYENAAKSMTIEEGSRHATH